uniref:Myb/SANT-like domain-containing protein n=1 Tax=Davidia involucrata TaxID=16924 RepID=A0A5B7BRF2_DAVIN
MYRKVYQTRSSNAKEKVKYVIWTNEMDRYFSKILVEHVRKGSKLDNIIKPATYAAALVALNEKFGLDLTKDHLKNRLKTLRKQFGVLKEILAQKGFKWDKARKMVVADDAVWNDYIKAHPDAKHFRAKFIENFEELCIIVGNDQAIASCSDNGAEVDVDLVSDNEGMETAIVSVIQSDDKQAKNLRWTKEMDRCLGKILVEEVEKGRKVDNIIQTEAYNTAVTALNEKFGPDITKDHIKNRLKTWKKQYGILKELLSHTGFKWDEARKMVIGDDSIWNDYIKTHHDAHLFRGRVVENYDHLCIIFGNNHATGSYSRTADDIVHSLAGDSEGVEAINASPIRCYSGLRDQEKNMKWTNEMDYCLSTILVEQVKLGNKSKLDNKFKPAAYDAAVSALSERFQLDFTKDHVRNRIKTWKKLYGSMKELLDHSEFKWDEELKMVTANDSVWHDYIKIKPDARLLQGLVIENYDELCVIIGNDNPTESSKNDAEADMDWAADNEGIETEVAYQSQPDNGKERGKYIIWTDEMDRCLTEKLVEQVKLGNKLEKNFKPVAYTAVVTTLNENFALDLTKENIKSRLKTWKKLYGLVKEVLSHRGFVWDEERKMVVATDSVWNEYIKMHPDAKFLRARSIEYFDELRIIIDNNHATGCFCVTGAKGDMNPTSNNEEHEETPLQNVFVDEEMSKDNTNNGTQGSSQQTRARPSSSSHSKQPSKKRHGSDLMVEMMSTMAANIGRIADALTGSNQSVCLDELFEMVQNIPGFDDDLIIEACEFLSLDEKRAKMFLKLDERLRKLWLLKRLRGHGN